MKLSKHVSSLLMAGVLVASASHAGATSLDRVSIDQLVADAEIIVQGIVQAVEYRNSDAASAEHVALPHTFVTFGIERAFKGSVQSGSSITLRFEGGPDGQGVVLMIPGIPLFDVGDRDILFIRGNGTQSAPLVGWEQGRYRIVQGMVYSDAGQEVWLTGRGKVVHGKQHALEEVVTHDLAGTAMEFGLEGQERDWTPPSGAERLDAAGFASFIDSKVERLPTARGSAATVADPSVYIQDEFYVTALTPEPPPSLPAPAEASGTSGEPDAYEEELLRQDGGNPVLDAPNP
jgi:hypothetical protein